MVVERSTFSGVAALAGVAKRRPAASQVCLARDRLRRSTPHVASIPCLFMCLFRLHTQSDATRASHTLRSKHGGVACDCREEVPSEDSAQETLSRLSASAAAADEKLFTRACSRRGVRATGNTPAV